MTAYFIVQIPNILSYALYYAYYNIHTMTRKNNFSTTADANIYSLPYFHSWGAANPYQAK